MGRERIHSIDILKGAALVLMVLYHGLFSLVYLFGVPLRWLESSAVVQMSIPLIGGCFVLMSGVSSQFSRSSLKRGVRIFLLGMMMTAVTALVVPELTIRFGILHLLGCSMMLIYFLRPLLDKIPTAGGLLLSLLLFAVSFRLPKGLLGLGPFSVEFQVRNPYLFPLGLLADGFSSSDYYPLMPWFFLFCAGSFLGRWIKEGRAFHWVYTTRMPFLEKLGRHTLLIYILHQPVLIALFWVAFRVFPLE